MEIKVCTKCKEEKNINSFTKRKQSKTGYSYYCKSCEANNSIIRSDKIKNNYIKNYDNYKDYSNNYYNKNKDYISKKNKERYLNNKEQIIQSVRLWQSNNKDIIKAYYSNNRNKIKEYDKGWKNNKRKTDLLFRLKDNLGTLIYVSLKNSSIGKFSKSKRIQEILNYTIIEFKQYIESLWEPWMNWDNYGLYNGELNYGWDLDHIVPISSAKTEEEIYLLNHYTNFQPLCSKINRDIKKDKLNYK